MEEKKEFIINACYYILKIVIFLCCGYLIFKYGLVIVISLFLSLLFKPMVDWLISFLNIQNKMFQNIIIIISMILFYFIVIILFVVIIYLLINALSFLPQYIEKIYRQLLQNQYLMTIAETIYQNLNTMIHNILVVAINQTVSILINMTSVLFHTFLCFVFSVLFLIDYDFIVHHILLRNHYGKTIAGTIMMMKRVLYILLKTYTVLFLVTFFILFIGFYFIHLDHCFLFAFLIALFDFFPVLGIEMIMVPWIIILAVFNQMKMAISLLVIYLIIAIAKNIIEPKLLSVAVGTKPIIMFVTMFLSAKIFGFMGMIVAPIIVFMIQMYISEREGNRSG